MSENVYDCLFILDSNKYAREPNAAGEKIRELIEQPGGEVLASRLWTEQKLAYPIKGHKKGTYWLSYFRMPTEKLDEFKRGCQLADIVLRNLVIKVEPALVDILVAHARGEAMPGEEGEGEEEGESGGESSQSAEQDAEPAAVE